MLSIKYLLRKLSNISLVYLVVPDLTKASFLVKYLIFIIFIDLYLT